MRRVSLVLFASLLIASPLAAGQAPERAVVATWDRQSFTFTSTAAANQTDVVEFSFDAPTAALDVVAQTFGGSAHWRLRWTSLVEFQDLDGNGAYNIGDPILQHIGFDEMSLPTVTVDQQADGATATVTYRQPNTFQPFVTLTFRIVGSIPQEGPLQSPMELHWTFMVDGFPFETDNKTRLGLEHRWAQTLRSSPMGAIDTEGAIVIEHAWDHRADIDDEPMPIDATVQSYARDTDGETIVFMTMPRGERIQHDAHIALMAAKTPVGLKDQIIQNIEGSWPFYLAGILGSALIVGYPWWLRREGKA